MELFFFFFTKIWLEKKTIYVQMLGNKTSPSINLCSLSENRIAMMIYISGGYGTKNRRKN